MKTNPLLSVPLLNTEEYRFAHSHFIECEAMELAKRDALAKEKIQKWVDELVLMTPAYSLRPDGLRNFIDSMYLVEDVRDFVFDVAFLFFVSWGLPHGAQRLSATLVEGLSLDGPDPALSMIPHQVMASMSYAARKELFEPLTWWERLLGRRQQSLGEFFASNKPVLVMYLMYLTHTNAPDA